MNQGAVQRIHFFKMTGTGNDFILIDNREKVIDSDRCRDFVRRACRRRLSVGADGIILIENDPEVDFKWRFFNADASEAEMCGNGARCAARFAYITGIVDKPRMAFRTLAGVIKAELSGNSVKVEMTLPRGLRLGLDIEAKGRSFELDFIDTGVPHAVCFVPDKNELESVDVEHWGRALRFHPYFQPAGTNVNFAWIQDASHICVRTYERGVEGETLACGTGAIASALISAARDQVRSPVAVETRSKESLTVHFDKADEMKHPQNIPFRGVCLEGEARIAYQANLWAETL